MTRTGAGNGQADRSWLDDSPVTARTSSNSSTSPARTTLTSPYGRVEMLDLLEKHWLI
jgi:hypothetical protein